MSPRGPVRWLDRLGLRRPRPDESVELEIEHHIAELADRLVAEGMDTESARSEAERRFGRRRLYERRMQAMESRQLAVNRWATRLDLLRQSFLSVSRMARREPGFVAAVVLTLALGIGANVTMFGILDRVLLSAPEHIVEPERVVRVMVDRLQGTPRILTLTNNMAYPDYLDLRSHTGFAGVAAYLPHGEHTLGAGASVERVWVIRASAELFPLLGVVPHLGRFYSSEETQPGSPSVVVLSFEYWTRAYGADQSVLGRVIELQGSSHTIVGVAPPDFTGVDLQRVDVWLPLELLEPMSARSCSTSRLCYGTRVVARLEAGESLQAAQVQATTLHLNGRTETIAAGRYSDRSSMVLTPLVAARGPNATADTRVARWLTGVSIVVLLIACANIANLMLARGTRLQREVGVRMALGAARSMIVSQIVLESLLLASVAGLAALALAQWGGQLVRDTLLPDVHFPPSLTTPRAVVFTLGASVVAGLFAALPPTFQGARVLSAATLYRQGLGGSARRSGLRSALTVAQSSMAAALLVAAGLFVRSLNEVRSRDLGLDVDRLVMVDFEYRSGTRGAPGEGQTVAAAKTRVDALPSVASSATVAFGLGQYAVGVVARRGTDSIAPLPTGGPWFYAVPPNYFETVGLSLVRGRGIEAADRADGESVVVISETMAEVFWPDGDPIGDYLVQPSNDAFRVVGIVEDAARMGYLDPPEPVYYLPLAQAPSRLGVGTLYVRARDQAEDIVDDVATALRGFSPEVRYARVRTVDDYLAPQARSWTLGATMFTLFGLLALVVAAVGLYSVLAFDVAQRTKELGIRAALGARKARLLRSVVSQGALMGALGVSLGLMGAWLAAPFVADLLYGVSPRDRLVFGAVATVLIAVSLAASLVPGLHATRVDPMVALRAD